MKKNNNNRNSYRNQNVLLLFFHIFDIQINTNFKFTSYSQFILNV